MITKQKNGDGLAKADRPNNSVVGDDRIIKQQPTLSDRPNNSVVGDDRIIKQQPTLSDRPNNSVVGDDRIIKQQPKEPLVGGEGLGLTRTKLSDAGIGYYLSARAPINKQY